VTDSARPWPEGEPPTLSVIAGPSARSEQVGAMMPHLKRGLTSAVLALFAGGISVLLLSTLWLGRHYYLLPRALRVDDELDPLLGSGGTLGVAMGFLGTSLMLVMMLYTVRKALHRWRALGPPAAWLRFHVICGVLGPLAIWVHTGFVWPVGLVAIAFWCMIAVALSGGFGRYVYAMVPRASGGKALAMGEAADALADLRARLVASTVGVDSNRMGEALSAVQDFEVPVRSLFDLLRLNFELARRRRIVQGVVAELPREVREEARDAFFAQLKLKQGLEASRVAGRLLRYWHLFHRPLAAAMYLIIAIHVSSAILLGGSLSKLGELFGG